MATEDFDDAPDAAAAAAADESIDGVDTPKNEPEPDVEDAPGAAADESIDGVDTPKTEPEPDVEDAHGAAADDSMDGVETPKDENGPVAHSDDPSGDKTETEQESHSDEGDENTDATTISDPLPSSPPSLLMKEPDGKKKTTPDKKNQFQGASSSLLNGAMGRGTAGSRPRAGSFGGANTMESMDVTDGLPASNPYLDFAELANMEGIDEDAFMQALYENPGLAAAAREAAAASTEEERAARRERMRLREEAREAGGEERYYRMPDGTIKKIAAQPDLVDILKEDGFPVKSWIVIGALFGFGLYQLRKSLKEPSVDSKAKGKREKAADRASPVKKRGGGKQKGKKGGPGKSKSSGGGKKSAAPKSITVETKASAAKKAETKTPAPAPKEVETKTLAPAPKEVETKAEASNEAETKTDAPKEAETKMEAPSEEDLSENNAASVEPQQEIVPKKKKKKAKKAPAAVAKDEKPQNGAASNQSKDGSSTSYTAVSEQPLGQADASGPETMLHNYDEEDRRAIMEVLKEEETGNDEGDWQMAGRKSKKQQPRRNGDIATEVTSGTGATFAKDASPAKGESAGDVSDGTNEPAGDSPVPPANTGGVAALNVSEQINVPSADTKASEDAKNEETTVPVTVPKEEMEKNEPQKVGKKRNGKKGKPKATKLSVTSSSDAETSPKPSSPPPQSTDDDAALARMLQMQEESMAAQDANKDAEESWEEVTSKKKKKAAAAAAAAAASPAVEAM